MMPLDIIHLVHTQKHFLPHACQGERNVLVYVKILSTY